MSKAPGRREECRDCAKRYRGVCIVWRENAEVPEDIVGICRALVIGPDGDWAAAERREHKRRQEGYTERAEDPRTQGRRNGLTKD